MNELTAEADAIQFQMASKISQASQNSHAAAKVAPSAAILDGSMSLWVEKYTPKSFSHLLSPEKINREVQNAAIYSQ